MAAIKRRGGIAVVQEPGEALFPDMPRSVVDHVDVDHVAPLGEMGWLLTQLVKQTAPPEENFPVYQELIRETEIVEQKLAGTYQGH